MKREPKMKPKPLGDTLKGKEDRKREILLAAFEVFAQRGYSGATMLEIARRARASKETLYSCFQDKADLFQSLLRSHVRRIDPGLPLDVSRSPDPYARLRKFAQSILTVTTRPEWVSLMRITIAEAPRFPELRAIMSDFLNRDRLINYLKLCRKRGLMEFEDAAEVASMFDALIDSGWMPQSLFGLIVEVKDSRISHQADFAARMLLKAVAPSGRSLKTNRKIRLARKLPHG